MKLAALILVPFATFGCASTAPPRGREVHATEGMLAAIARYEAALGAAERVQGLLENTAGDVQAVVELTEVRLDSVEWVETLVLGPSGPEHVGPQEYEPLLCQLREWPGSAALRRFVQAADTVFYLECPGHRAIEAWMARGGTGSSIGDWGVAILVVPPGLESGAEYHVRPRNENTRYLWTVAEGVRVSAK